MVLIVERRWGKESEKSETFVRRGVTPQKCGGPVGWLPDWVGTATGSEGNRGSAWATEGGGQRANRG